MILTKSMCKGWGWMKESGLTWREYLDRCRKYDHRLFVSGAVKSLFLKYMGIAGDPDEHKWHEPSKAKRLKAFFADIEWDEVTANLERTPYYARQRWKQTLCLRPTQADSAELFTFAADPINAAIKCP